MAVILIILNLHILTSRLVFSDTNLDHGREEAYVRLTYPTHPDIKLELYQQARVHKSGGPILPKPISFRQPSFVITSFQADLHRPANDGAPAGEPSYVIKPFKAQLFDHVPSFTTDGKPTVGKEQVPFPGPVEVSVAETESVREKIKMPLVLEANSRRRHFSSSNSSQATSFHKYFKDKPTQLPTLPTVGENSTKFYSSNFSIPPYPLSKLATQNFPSPYEFGRNEVTKTATKRPAKTQVIQSLLKQLLEATRDDHSVEDNTEEKLIKSEIISDGSQLTPLPPFMLERLTTTYPTTHLPFDISTLAPNQTEESFVLLMEPVDRESNVPNIIQEPEKIMNEEQLEATTTTNEEPLETTTLEIVETTDLTPISDLVVTLHRAFDASAMQDNAKTVENSAVQHSTGPVVISSSYGGSRIFSMASSDSNKTETKKPGDINLNVTTLTNDSLRLHHLPIQLGSDNFTAAVSESLKIIPLANETYRERIVKIASLYVAELIANVMALTHHHTTPTPLTNSAGGIDKEEKVEQPNGESTTEISPEKPKVEGNEGTSRLESPKGKKTQPLTKIRTETIVRTAHHPVVAGRPVFVVEAKTSYVYPTDTPLPSNYEQVHRKEYHTLTENDEDYDNEELPAYIPTPFQLIRG